MKFKKFIQTVTSAALSLTLVISSCPMEQVFAAAYENEVWYDFVSGEIQTWGDYVVVDNESEITLVQYTGNESEINIPEGVTAISEFLVWKNKKNIVSITFPITIRNLGYEVFGGMTSLKEVNIPEGVTAIPQGVFRYCTSLEKVNLPSTLTKISDNAFRGCTALKKITLPEGLQTIGYNAFDNSGLTEITIPSTVTTVKTLFWDCADLKKIVIKSSDTKLEYWSKKSNTATLYVPKGSNAEKTAKKLGLRYVVTGQKTYTVKRGDTLWGISHKYLGAGIRYKEIMELNGLKSTLIHAGKKLYLPEK